MRTPIPAAAALFDQMADAVYLLDPATSTVLWANRAAWAVLGLTREEVLGLGPSDAALLTRWELDPACAPPGGESILNIQERIVRLAEELREEFAGSSVVFVSHVGPIKAFLAAVLEMPLQCSRRFFLDPGTISVVEWGAHPTLRLFNSHAHLGWSSARWM